LSDELIEAAGTETSAPIMTKRQQESVVPAAGLATRLVGVRTRKSFFCQLLSRSDVARGGSCVRPRRMKRMAGAWTPRLRRGLRRDHDPLEAAPQPERAAPQHGPGSNGSTAVS